MIFSFSTNTIFLFLIFLVELHDSASSIIAFALGKTHFQLTRKTLTPGWDVLFWQQHSAWTKHARAPLECFFFSLSSGQSDKTLATLNFFDA